MDDLRGWDVVLRDGKALTAVIISIASKPNEVYTILDGNVVCLSQHGKAVSDLDIGEAKPLYCSVPDGAHIDSVLTTPKNYQQPKPWPAIVLLHGGPYSCVTCGFDIPLFNRIGWLAAAGYAVLCVNYRGSSTHGDKFVADMRGAAGVKDYGDIIDAVQAGIKAGFIGCMNVVRVGLQAIPRDIGCTFAVECFREGLAAEMSLESGFTSCCW